MYREFSTEQLVVLRDRYAAKKKYWEDQGYTMRLRPNNYPEQYLITTCNHLGLLENELLKRRNA